MSCRGVDPTTHDEDTLTPPPDSTRDIVIELRADVRGLVKQVSQLAEITATTQLRLTKISEDLAPVQSEINGLKTRLVEIERDIREMPTSDKVNDLHQSVSVLATKLDVSENKLRMSDDVNKRVIWVAKIAGAVALAIIGALATTLIAILFNAPK